MSGHSINRQFGMVSVKRKHIESLKAGRVFFSNLTDSIITITTTLITIITIVKALDILPFIRLVRSDFASKQTLIYKVTPTHTH